MVSRFTNSRSSCLKYPLSSKLRFGFLFTTCACEDTGNKNPLQRKEMTKRRYENETETKKNKERKKKKGKRKKEKIGKTKIVKL